MKIRKATKDDIEWVTKEFIIESEKEPYNEKWTNEIAKKKIINDFKNNKVVILEDKERVGFVMFNEYFWEDQKVGSIELIIIPAKYQGKGYGKMLLNYVEEYFKNKNINKITLLSEIGSKAFEIYNKIGYKQTKLIMMKKKLK
jgi:ribosomal protein S18 acetylase RimI-like enzyme